MRTEPGAPPRFGQWPPELVLAREGWLATLGGKRVNESAAGPSAVCWPATQSFPPATQSRKCNTSLPHRTANPPVLARIPWGSGCPSCNARSRPPRSSSRGCRLRPTRTSPHFDQVVLEVVDVPLPNGRSGVSIRVIGVRRRLIVRVVVQDILSEFCASSNERV